MESMVIDRETRPETILSFMGGGMRVELSKLSSSMIAVTSIDDEGVPTDDEIDAIFDDFLFDMTGHKFNRDEANDYE